MQSQESSARRRPNLVLVPGPSDSRKEYHMEVLEKPEVDCIDVVNLLGDYTDDELTPTVRGRIDSHVEHCGYCRRMMDSYLTTVSLARELGDRPLPVDTQRRLRESLNKRLGITLKLDRSKE